MFKRDLYKKLQKRLLEKENFIQALVGPRQVGKTTLMTQLLKGLNVDHHFVSADRTTAGLNWIEQQWEVARVGLKQSASHTFILVIDEVQKVDNWSEQVKSQWDFDKRNDLHIKVVLLGSSRLLLQEGLTESLAGRFELLQMGHWSYREMHTAFGYTPEEYVWFGGYPGAATFKDDEERFKNYIVNTLIETTISKDILMLTRIEKPALLRSLFEIGCLYSGQMISYTKIMGQLKNAGNTTTLAHYLSLLDVSGLLGGLEKYSKDVTRQRGSSPKFQVYNTALMSSQMVETFDAATKDSTLWGRMVESAVGAHIYNCSISGGYTVMYWRDRNDEVDFVLRYKNRTIGIEVKSGTTNKAKGMEAFNKKCKPDKIFLVGTNGITWQNFLKTDPRDLF